MSLTPGAKLGPYEILEAIGKGGMGEVYKAHDPRLRRDVAIKTSAERFNERFEREARAVAALNHPNICQIYDVGPNYLVMEYIEGPTLSERIKEGAIPLEEALLIAEQIAAALEAAHEKTITHRDLKPANIKVRADGTVKVLDFGLAKLGGTPVAPSEDSPTLSMAATQAGMILGTAGYMAPEQAKGKPVDKRADIWAFGVVLYEMVTGHRLFKGEDMVEILAAVVHGQPDLSAVPPRVRKLIAKCLEKDPKKRLRDMSGMELLLEVGQAPAPDASSKRPAAGFDLGWIAAGVAAAVAIGAVWMLWPKPKPLLPLTRLEVDLGESVSLGASIGPDVVISPDGARLLYISNSRLYLVHLDQPQSTAMELPGTVGAIMPTFSPDGNWIVFAQSSLKKIAASGGAPQVIASSSGVRGISWEGDFIVAPLSAGAPLMKIPAAGGTPQTLTKLNGETSHRWPQILPGGKAVLLTVQNSSSFDTASIDVQSMPEGVRKNLIHGGSFGRYVEASDGTGYLTYVSRGTLFAVPFDAGKLEISGTPTPVLEGVSYNPTDGSALISYARSGTLVYRSGTAGGTRVVRFMNAAGKAETFLSRPDSYLYPRLSPDGQRLLIVASEAGTQDLWVYDLKGGRSTRLTIGLGATFAPIWTPDGRYVLFQGTGGMFWTRSDGGSQPQPLIQSKNTQHPWSITRDGKHFAYQEVSPTTSYDLWTAPLEITNAGVKAGTPEKLLQSPREERHPSFSPDGRWIAYSTDETGRYEVYVRAFPDTGGRWSVSVGGGHYPLWSTNGKELFYRTEDGQVMVAAYTTKGDALAFDPPRKFSEQRLAPVVANGTYDLMPDGRIVGLFPAEETDTGRAQSHVTFLFNFADEIRRRFSTGK
ncbi:MAG: protein kinase [Acidobacteriota bacterium]